MTNGDRLRAMDDKELAGEIWTFASSEIMTYIDLPAWLAQEDEAYPIRGQDAIARMDGEEEYQCKIVGETTVFNRPYYQLVMDEDFPYTSRVLQAPKKSVTIFQEAKRNGN